jgi:hypothetical protein
MTVDGILTIRQVEYTSTVNMARQRPPAHAAPWGRMWPQSSGRLTSCARRSNLNTPAANHDTELSARRAQRSGTRCRGSHIAQASRDATGVRRTCRAQRPTKASPSSTRYTRSSSSDSSSLSVLSPRWDRPGRHLGYRRSFITTEWIWTRN